MEPDDFLCSRNARPPKALARASGTSWRASGWAGEKAVHSRKSFSPHRDIKECLWRTWMIEVRRGENRG